jgi:hypothetical protein
MASPELSRRVGKAVAYPPLSEMSDIQRREFHETSTASAPARRGRGGGAHTGELSEARLVTRWLRVGGPLRDSL